MKIGPEPGPHGQLLVRGVENRAPTDSSWSVGWRRGGGRRLRLFLGEDDNEVWPDFPNTMPQGLKPHPFYWLYRHD
jgi:hypothetical protein